jgi:heme-degrading monooxygenase HmoA
MTIMMTSDMPGTSQGEYEQLAAALLPVLQAADGFIAHAAGPVEGGYRVTELWESEAAHSAWFAAHVAPAMPPAATLPIITTRPITTIATRA